ncbi:MAG: SAM-dependent chlorinase/fluorinase [Chlamydiae bacterium]|nr:SAM-dependent chlorinase/fluorinase [Chlamydiota bacterium]
MSKKNEYLRAIESFTKKCRDIEGIFDVLLRGTSTDMELIIENWSDIDFSVIVKESSQNVYQNIRQIANEIRTAFNFKISITLVALSDFIRKNHNHGIKPEYYTNFLDQSKSLFGKDTLTLRNYSHNYENTCIMDCFHNIVYLVHDIRSKYLQINRENFSNFQELCRYILKRSQYVIINAIFVITKIFKPKIDILLFKKLFGEKHIDFAIRLLRIKEDWANLNHNPESLDQMTSEAMIVSDFVYDVTCSYIDQLRRKTKIIIFSDCTDIAFNEIHQKLTNELELLGANNCEIAPLVKIKNFSMINAAFSIRLLAELCSSGTIFLVIVNGVNTNPIRIFGETKNGIIFVGNNSGYFSWLLKDFGVKKLYQTKITRFVDNRSFGGRNVQAPIAAMIASGIKYENLGEPCDESILNMMEIEIGTVVHIDNFGLMKINLNISEEIITSSSIDIFVNNEYKVTAKYVKKMKTAETGEWVVFSGSSLTPPLLELARVRSSHSANELRVVEGDKISMVCKHESF